MEPVTGDFNLQLMHLFLCHFWYKCAKCFVNVVCGEFCISARDNYSNMQLNINHKSKTKTCLNLTYSQIDLALTSILEKR